MMKSWDSFMRQGKQLDGYLNYIGTIDHKNMIFVISQTRDSSCTEKRKFSQVLKSLGGESTDVQVHHFGHWAIGWIDQILINPENAKLVKKSLRYSTKLIDK
jgi:hypothetical protein